MNVQDGVQVNVPSSTPSSSAPSSASASVQRIMPVLYVNQANVKTVTSTTPSSTHGVLSSSGPTILTAVPQIQLAGGGNAQIIHSSPNASGTYSYVPMRHLYQQAKSMKDAPKKVLVTSINSGPNNKSNQVNLILPNNQTNSTGNKSPITSLILPQIGTMANKATITGMLLPSGASGANNSKTMASLLLPANAKYPNIAPNKKVPIPNIIIPQQNINNKPPSIIRQTSTPQGKNVMGIFSPPSNATNSQMTSLLLTPNTNSNSKQPPTSVGLILPGNAGSHGIIVQQSTSAQTHGIIVPQSSGAQTHGITVTQGSGSIIVPQSSAQTHGIIVPSPSGGSSHGIIVPQSTNCQSQVTNLIITSTSGIPHTTNTPVASLLISNNSGNSSNVGSGHMTSLLIPQVSANNTSPQSMGLHTTMAGSGNIPKSVLVPIPNKNSVGAIQPVPYNGKKNVDTMSLISAARENKQSVLVKAGVGVAASVGVTGEGNYPSLPPLQPITNKEAPKSLLGRPPNGINVPETLIMTPVADNDNKNKLEKITDDMTIERTSVTTEERGTSMVSNIKMDDRNTKTDDERSEPGMTMPLRDEGVVLDGEVTVRRLGPNKEVVPQKKPLEDDVKIELVKPERQKLPPPRYQKPEDLNPMDVLEWDQQGVGKLPGSNIKFRINEFGLDLVVDANKDESTSVTPNSSRPNSVEKTPVVEDKIGKDLMGEGTDKIYCCEGCGCYGLYTEFLVDTRFCSVGCKKIVLARNEMKRKRQDDKIRELRLRRKRRKIKILAQRSKRGSVEQKVTKEQQQTEDKQAESVDEVEMISKAWTNKMTDLRRVKKVSEGGIKMNMQVSDSASVASTTEKWSSDSEGDSSLVQENKSKPASEDDASSDKTRNCEASKEQNWLNNSGEFMWPLYLQKSCNKAKAAPIRLFKDPFPYGKNGFKVGMKLEGIDPEHQAIICVLTVAQVKGHRIRLHFDGFPDHHDFWSNSDSPDIFPPGWCERNSHSLQPPRGYSSENFSWNTYLKQCRAQPAPKSLFPKSNTPLCPSQFRVGMKLEAVDRKNSSLVCVASVGDLIDNRLLIHFDSWGDVYDYWTDPSSPYIHPVGWCHQNGHDLTPPNNYKNPSQFSWDAYMKESKSAAAPARAFKPRAPNTFKRGMKLEAIDKRAPTCLRPATIKEVLDYQIKITFDGFPEEFGYWVDDDCPDLHPTGWGHKTGHPVTPPPPPGSTAKSHCCCGTIGCTGDGNIKGGHFTQHTIASLCPYAPQNLNRENIPDRFCVNPDFYEVPEPISKTKSTSTKQDPAEDSSCSESRVKTRFSSTTIIEEIKEEPITKTEPAEEKTEERIERRGRKRKIIEPPRGPEQWDSLRRELISTVLTPGYTPAPAAQELWSKHVAALSHKVNVTGGDPRSWNHKQVAAFVNTVIPSRAKLFLDQEVDGESFLMLTQNDLTKVLGLKLGPALKIYNCIILLRRKVMSL